MHNPFWNFVQKQDKIKWDYFGFSYNPNITLEEAKVIIESGDSNAINTFKIKDKIVNIKSGEFGPYLQIVSGKKKQNISIPKSYDINKLNISHVLEIIASKNKNLFYS